MSLPPSEYPKGDRSGSPVVGRDKPAGALISRGKAIVDNTAEEPQNKNAGNRSAGNRLTKCAV